MLCGKTRSWGLLKICVLKFWRGDWSGERWQNLFRLSCGRSRFSENNWLHTLKTYAKLDLFLLTHVSSHSNEVKQARLVLDVRQNVFLFLRPFLKLVLKVFPFLDDTPGKKSKKCVQEAPGLWFRSFWQTTVSSGGFQHPFALLIHIPNGFSSKMTLEVAPEVLILLLQRFENRSCNK